MLTKDAVDVSGVISEEDASKSCKGAHEVGLDGHWGLDARYIACCMESGCAARHDVELIENDSVGRRTDQSAMMCRMKKSEICCVCSR
jgi:hypothetical protein